MAGQSLPNYIREELKRGYSPLQLKAYLLQYHYTESQINEAFSQIQPGSQTGALSGKANKERVAIIAAAIFSLILLGGFGYYLISSFPIPEKMLQLSFSLHKQLFEPGENVRIKYNLENLIKKKAIDAEVKFEVYDSGNSLVASTADRISLKDSFAGEKTMALEKNIPPGEYSFTVSAYYPEGSDSASRLFSVEKAPPKQEVIVVRECPSSCDDLNPCTRDYCSAETGYACMHDVTSPCCGDSICSADESYETCLSDCDAPENAGIDAFQGKSIFERIDIIGDIGKRDYPRAVEQCRAIEVLSYQNDCLGKVAVKSGKLEACESIVDERSKDDCYFDYAVQRLEKDICEKVAKDSRRDQCHMEFVNKGDYSVCAKLVNRYLKQSCDSLSQLSTFDASQVDLSQFNLTALGFSSEDEFRAYMKSIAVNPGLFETGNTPSGNGGTGNGASGDAGTGDAGTGNGASGDAGTGNGASGDAGTGDEESAEIVETAEIG